MFGMTVWEELRAALVRLRDEQPGSLMQYPMPEADQAEEPPFTIRLAPWAIAAAEELHQQFGDGCSSSEGSSGQRVCRIAG
jgi:hypothetical protein